MPRKATGNAVRYGDKWYARVATAPKKRPAIHLPTCGPDDEEQARRRATLMADVVRELRKARRDDFIAKACKNIATLAEPKLSQFVTLARGYAVGSEHLLKSTTGAATFRKFAERWTSGGLARDFPGRVKNKKRSSDDKGRLEKWVYPVLEDVPLPDVTLDHYDAILRAVTGSDATRRHVGQVIRRVLQLAVYPARLIAFNPIPRGALPSKGVSRAFPYLYPSEDRALLGCKDVPLSRRVFYGFLDREGMREREAFVLTWEQLDLERGTVSVEDNKTDDFRTRPLDAGVVAALGAWKAVRKAKSTNPVFCNDDGSALNGDRLAEQLRRDMKKAGIDRRELFTNTDKRGHMRAHDLRATFVTISLAAGKSETWVADRTGHHSSDQIGNYRRAARTAAELGHTALDPLDEAIPEFRGKGRKPGSKGSKASRDVAKRHLADAKRRGKRRLAARRHRRAVFRFHHRKMCGFDSRPVHHVDNTEQSVVDISQHARLTTQSTTLSARELAVVHLEADADRADAEGDVVTASTLRMTASRLRGES
jgi:integrase